MSKPGLLTLTVKDKSALYLAYMPFIKNGGLFIPTSRNYHLGDQVYMLLSLMDDPAKIPMKWDEYWNYWKKAQDALRKNVEAAMRGQKVTYVAKPRVLKRQA